MTIITLTITEAIGFGKTTTVNITVIILLWKNNLLMALFIELGPQATDRSIKLRAIYNLLTDEQHKIYAVE